MSDEPQPLRLKPRTPAGGEPSAPPAPPPPPAPPAPAADQGEGTARLRLKPRLNLSEDKAAKPADAAPPPDPFVPPPPPPAAPPMPEPAAAAEPDAEAIPRIKLRPKNAPAASAPPPPAFAAPPEPFIAPPEPFIAPPEPRAPPPPPPSGASEGSPLPPPPPPGRPNSMPPMSVLSAPPPPAPGSAPEAPPAPGSAPRLSLATPGSGAPKPPLNIKVTEVPLKVGGKPVVKPGKPGKFGKLGKLGKLGKAPTPGDVLGKRSALGPVAKAGIAVLAVAIVIGGIFSYRIFFPAPSKDVHIKLPTVVKPVAKAVDDAQNALAAKRKAEQAKVDAAVAGEDAPTPTPTVNTAATESVLVPTDLTSDVKVNTTHLDAAPAASAAFRTFVANASIGGVFQGTPSRALVNGSIVREGQTVDSALGIAFDRIDSAKKAIFFKDSTGAEVSKNY